MRGSYFIKFAESRLRFPRRLSPYPHLPFTLIAFSRFSHGFSFGSDNDSFNIQQICSRKARRKNHNDWWWTRLSINKASPKLSFAEINAWLPGPFLGYGGIECVSAASWTQATQVMSASGPRLLQRSRWRGRNGRDFGVLSAGKNSCFAISWSFNKCEWCCSQITEITSACRLPTFLEL